MKKNHMTGRIKASVMSVIMAASAVPAYMLSMPVSAAVAPAVAVTSEKTAVASVAVGDSARLYTADYAKEGSKFINITFTPDFTGNLSYGFGIGTATSPYWYELDGKTGKFIDTSGTAKASGTDVACVSGTPVTISIDISSLDIKFDPSTSKYPGEFEFRNYYAGESKSTVSITSITGSATSQATDTPSDPSDPSDDPTPSEEDRTNIIPNNNKHTNGDNWSFIDNGDGTATIISTVARQLSDLDLTLTKGYDEDYYAANPDEEVTLINSHKFKYSDFGITDLTGITLESLTVVVEPDVEMDQFVYGGGLNVVNKSPADTEYAKQVAGIEGKESSGYWYNDMGLEGDGSVAYFEEQGVEFGITPGNGGKIFDAGKYIKAYWEIPQEVQPYVTYSGNDAISFQYWWGNDTEGEEVESVKVTEAVLTYTKEVTVPYTSSVATAVKKTINHTGTDAEKNLEVAYSDLGLEEDMDVYAIRFDITAKSDIDKLVYNVGTGVTEDVSEDYWFQEDTNFCILEAGDSAQIMWIVPEKAAGNSEHANGVNTKDGKVQIGYYYGESDAISIDNIEVYYNVPATTTTTTTTTTTITTTTTTTTTTAATTTATTSAAAAPTATLWGDANVDDKVSLADAVAILQSIANKDKYALTEQGKINADVSGSGDGVTPNDALTIQKVDANIIKQTDLPIQD